MDKLRRKSGKDPSLVSPKGEKLKSCETSSLPFREERGDRSPQSTVSVLNKLRRKSGPLPASPKSDEINFESAYRFFLVVFGMRLKVRFAKVTEGGGG